jgi:hypothetical protein
MRFDALTALERRSLPLHATALTLTRRVDEIEAAVTIARYLDYWKRL